MLAPNIGVVKEKEIAYKNKEYSSHIKMQFFYSGYNKERIEPDTNVLVYVVDSFSYFYYKIKKRIDWLLVDESHSVETGSLFRTKLLELNNLIAKFKKRDTAIVYVTATMNQYSPVDIIIENKHEKKLNITVSNSFNDTFKRAYKDYKDGKKVAIFTQNIHIIKRFADEKGVLIGNFIMGKTIREKLVSKVRIRQNRRNKLIISTSTGFEGHSILTKGFNVYIFENRNVIHECFFLSNIIQAFGRFRNGTSYCEWCVIPVKEVPSIDYNLLKININKKLSKDLHPRVIYRDANRVIQEYLYLYQVEGKWHIELNAIRLQLHHERQQTDLLIYDNNIGSVLQNVEFNYLNNEPKKLPHKKKAKHNKTTTDFLLSNGATIDIYKLLGNPLQFNGVSFKAAITYVEKFIHLRRFAYNKDYAGDSENANCADQGRPIMYTEQRGLEILKSELLQREIKIAMIEAYKIHKGLPNVSVNEESITERKKKLDKLFIELVVAFMNVPVYIKPRISGNRNYDAFNLISTNEIIALARYFNITVTHIDIVSCFPRIIYTMCDLPLPDNFYGINKKNKKKINIFLNNFMYSAGKRGKRTGKILNEEEQRKRAIKQFRVYNFDEVVIKYLMDKYFITNSRGSLFYDLEYHEKKIVNELIEYFTSKFKPISNDGVIRKHDGIIVFNHYETVEYDERLDEEIIDDNMDIVDFFKYNEQGGFLAVK